MTIAKGTDQPQLAGAGLPVSFAQAFTNCHLGTSGRKSEKSRMSEVGKWIDDLMAAGCMPKVAARVVTECYAAGMRAAPSKDPAAEKRREWDRNYRRRRNEKVESGGSGGNRVELAPTQWLWTEGQGLLRQLGASETAARGNIGRWLKAGNDPATIKQLVVDVHQKGIGDPVPWVTKALGNAKGRTNGTGTRTTAAAADDLIARAEDFERQGAIVIDH